MSKKILNDKKNYMKRENFILGNKDSYKEKVSKYNVPNVNIDFNKEIIDSRGYSFRNKCN